MRTFPTQAALSLRSAFVAIAIAMCLATSLGAQTATEDEAGEEGEVTVALDASGYAPGDTVWVTVANGLDVEVLFSLVCDAFVEGQHDGEWITAFEPDCSRVRVIPTRLAPGDSVEAMLPFDVFDVVDTDAHEELRLRLRVQREDGSTLVAYSAPFAVESR